MNEKIDALAVMALAYRHLNGGHDSLTPAEHMQAHAGMKEARAAISELIEKAETAEQALRNLVTAGAHPNWSNYADDLRIALARIGSA